MQMNDFYLLFDGTLIWRAMQVPIFLIYLLTTSHTVVADISSIEPKSKT
jgi:hypothetical protein